MAVRAPRLVVLAVFTAGMLGGCTTTTTTTMTPAQRDTMATVQQHLDRLRSEIDSLEAKSRVAGSRARERIEHELGTLRAQRDSAAGLLHDLESTSRATWENTKRETDRALAGLERAIATARSHIHVDSLGDSTGVHD